MRTAAQPETSVTRRKLLRAALDLMLRNGFSATGVEDVCRKAAVTKGSFFHYFKSKEELGRAVLDLFVQERRAAAMKSPYFRKEDPLDRVLAWADFATAQSRDPRVLRGCLLGTFSQELAVTHEGIQKACQAKFEGWAESIQKDLDLAVEIHKPSGPIDTKSLAEHLVAVLEGSIILAKAKKDGKPIRESLGHFKRYVKGLFGR
jgi:TetR/AcrR family transcriptional repressor of nem operon